MLQQALEQLLTAVSQKAPQLSTEDATKVTQSLLVWLAENLASIQEFRDIVEGLEYDKHEEYGEWDVRGEGIEDWWPDWKLDDETTSLGK